MINSRWGTEIIDEARDYNAHDPDEEIEVDEPRFKSHMNWNHVRFQQGENDNEENAGEHVRNQLCHTLKIVQSNAIDVKWLKKDIVKQDFTGSYRSHALPPGWRRCECLKQHDFTGWGKPQPLRLGYIHASMAATLAFRGCLPPSASGWRTRLSSNYYLSPRINL